MKKKVSICVPVLNEEKNIVILVNKINNFFRIKLNNKYDYEIIFTDNASTDRTGHEIIKLKKKFKNLRYYRFFKNVGYDISLLKNYQLARGDVAISLHCDLQDPIEKIKQFLSYWLNGHDLVYGKIIKRNENYILTLLRKIYYFLFNILCFKNKKLPINAVDFRLIDKKIINKIKKHKKNYSYARGLTYYLSSNPASLNYSRRKRKFGKSKFNLKNNITYAINSLIKNTNLGQYCLFGSLINFFYIILFDSEILFFYTLCIMIIIILLSKNILSPNLDKIKIKKFL